MTVPFVPMEPGDLLDKINICLVLVVLDRRKAAKFDKISSETFVKAVRDIEKEVGYLIYGSMN